VKAQIVQLEREFGRVHERERLDVAQEGTGEVILTE
jgi:hypothetical protein